MKLHVGLSVKGLALLGCAMAMTTGMAAPAWAAPDPEAAQFTCDLTGDCDTATAAPAGTSGAAPASAVPGKPAPRGSATRGFSFKRASTDGQTASATTATPAAPAPALVRPVRVGSADLGLAFEPASAVLTEGSKMRLNKYASALTSAKLSTRRLRIEGHTDASGSPRANKDLSQRRAQAVADYLVQAGVDRSRLDVTGFGSSKPLPGVPAQAAANRRVMAVLL